MTTSPPRPPPPPTSPTSPSPLLPDMTLPIPYSPGSDTSVSDDGLSMTEDDISGSWMRIDGSSSPLESSVLGDSSSEDGNHDGWIPSTDEESIDGDVEDNVNHIEAHLTPLPPPLFSQLIQRDPPSSLATSSLAGESFVDGEAAQSSFFGSDRTINQSRIELILPDPNGSFSGSTPNASFQDINPFIRDIPESQPRFGLDESFRSDTTSTSIVEDRKEGQPLSPVISKGGRGSDSLAPFGMKGPSFGRGDETWLRDRRLYATAVKGDQKNSTSVGVAVQTEKTELDGSLRGKLGVMGEKGDSLSDSGIAIRQDQKDHSSRINRLRDLSAEKLNRLKEIGSNWPFRVALASLITLALVGAIGPGFNLSSLKQLKQVESSKSLAITPSTPPIVDHGKTRSIWDSLSLSPLAVTTTASADSLPSKPTVAVADLQLIRHALSILSTDTGNTAPYTPEPSITNSNPVDASASSISATDQEDVVVPRRKRFKRVIESKSCCSVSVRTTDTEVAVAATESQETRGNLSNIAKLWSRKALKSQSDGLNESRTPNSTSVAQQCICGLGEHVRMALSTHMNRVYETLRPLSAIASLSFKFDDLIAPTIRALQKEYLELVNLAAELYNSTLTMSRRSLQRALDGLHVSRDLWSRSKTNTLETKDPKADAHSHSNHDGAKQSPRHLEERVVELEEKGLGPLNQARKGLDKLVQDVQRYRSSKIKKDLVEGTQKENEEPMPFGVMGQAFGSGTLRRGWADKNRKNRQWTESFNDERGRRRHHHKGSWGRRVVVNEMVETKKVKRETGKKKLREESKTRWLIDMVHNGAVQLVR